MTNIGFLAVLKSLLISFPFVPRLCPPPPPQYVVLSAATENGGGGGSNNMHPLGWGGGHKRKRSQF